MLDVFARAEGQARMFAGLAGDPQAKRLLKDLAEANTAVAELLEAAEAVARIQINRHTPANDLGKTKQVRLRAAIVRATGGAA
ncbi:hypothetical protein [Stenotrophomonas sp.]|uniref:hypothetical protein n=1 Tax=Stenotrophomonas sp. TaxID=69392 RepID=UPI0028ADC653|nr:hypothetical protein [Stenotrophomonas sp.]